jgi:tartrate dehydratase alpha subunit/fumarate hydratase class I-like protein
MAGGYTNTCIARDESMPIYQDTDMAIIFMQLSQDVHEEGNVHLSGDKIKVLLVPKVKSFKIR